MYEYDRLSALTAPGAEVGSSQAAHSDGRGI